MSLTAKSLLVISGSFLLSAIVFLAFYGVSGQYVDENGWLVEEFWALGLGTFVCYLRQVLAWLLGSRFRSNEEETGRKRAALRPGRARENTQIVVIFSCNFEKHRLKQADLGPSESN